jgi:hypothetical protein
MYRLREFDVQMRGGCADVQITDVQMDGGYAGELLTANRSMHIE